MASAKTMKTRIDAAALEEEGQLRARQLQRVSGSRPPKLSETPLDEALAVDTEAGSVPVEYASGLPSLVDEEEEVALEEVVVKLDADDAVEAVEAVAEVGGLGPGEDADGPCGANHWR